MTEKEIITALDCCYGFHCEKCPLKGDAHCGQTLKDESVKLIQSLQAEVERLKEECDKNFEKWEILDKRTKERYAELYEEAKSVIRAEAIKKPVCMPGDTVYFPASGGEAYPATVRKIIYDTSWIAFEEAAIGKQVFLTKEAAERAGAKNGNNSNT